MAVAAAPHPTSSFRRARHPLLPPSATRSRYAVSVRNLGGQASRVFLAVQLPSQVTYTGSQSDRGAGCTGATALTCDLDFLAGDLVATVRITAVVRQVGTLTLTAVSSSQPGDAQTANDTAGVTTVVATPAAIEAPVRVAAALRAVGATRVTRARGTATVSVRFAVAGAARLEGRLTPLRSTRPLTLLAGTTLAGARVPKSRPAASARVTRAATYLFKARVGSAKLIRGRTYLVRLTAVGADGRRRALAIRVRA